jgi:predicted nucleotidyltransferase
MSDGTEWAMVAEIIEQNKDEISAVCREHRIRTLWLFGSATSESWAPESSDLDFLVDLGEYSSDYAHRFFSLRRALVDLFRRKVDLLSIGGFGRDDDWFRHEVESTKVIVYDARRDQLVA